MAKRSRKPLWTCPECGHKFITRNMWHSCSHHTISEHFRGVDRNVKRTYDRYVRIVRGFGRVTIYAQKTRIVFMVRVRFGGAVVRKKHLHVNFWLTRRAVHPLLTRLEFIAPKYHLYSFRLTDPKQLDAALIKLLKEAYSHGCQEDSASTARLRSKVKPNRSRDRLTRRASPAVPRRSETA